MTLSSTKYYEEEKKCRYCFFQPAPLNTYNELTLEAEQQTDDTHNLSHRNRLTPTLKLRLVPRGYY